MVVVAAGAFFAATEAAGFGGCWTAGMDTPRLCCDDGSTTCCNPAGAGLGGVIGVV